MASDEKIDLDQQRKAVEEHIHQDAHGQVAKICRAVIQSHPTNLLWLRLLCCAMIHLSEFRPLLKVIESYSDRPSTHNALLFYKLYALYLMKSTETAQSVFDQNAKRIDTLPAGERAAARYLHFQILYRLGSYPAALDSLSVLQKGDDRQEYATEIAINRISTLIAMNRSAEAVEQYQNSTDSDMATNCDFVFNVATAMVLSGHCGDALRFLMQSIPRCRKAMQDDPDDFDEKEMESEIASLQLLSAYCMHSEGDTVGAAKLYETLLSEDRISGHFTKLVLRHNLCAVRWPESRASVDGVLFKKLTMGRNQRHLLRIGYDDAAGAPSEVLRAYHNHCCYLMTQQTGDDAEKKEEGELHRMTFQQILGEMKARSPLSELPLFLRVSRFFEGGQWTRCRDVLAHYLSTHSTASSEVKLWYVESLAMTKKHRMAIHQLRAMDDAVKYQRRSIEFMLNVAAHKLNDDTLRRSILTECIQYFEGSGTDPELMESLQVRLCRLLISKKKMAEAKATASKLCAVDGSNQRYKALLLLAAVHDGDFDLAEKLSSEIHVDAAEVESVSVDDLLAEIPNPMQSDKPMRFAISEEMELQRKRAANRRRRQRKAAKLRAKYKEHPELFKEPVDWKNDKKEDRKKGKEEEKESKTKEKGKRDKKQKGTEKKKKKKVYSGAQGGTTGGEDLQIHDIGDPRNKKKSKSGKTMVPKHIKKRKRRK